MIKIGISGFCGKMGQRVFNLAKQDKDLEVVFGLERAGHPEVGKTIDGVRVISDNNEISTCDCLIDFSSPLATSLHILSLTKYRKSAVIGTTGLTPQQEENIKNAAQTIPIVYSPNMSVGVNLLFSLIKKAAAVLKGYDVYVEEAHHIHKKDAPSGTAKKIVSLLKEEGFSISAEEVKAKREGEIVGDHRVIFENEREKLELFHSAKTRDIFAEGALLAAKWVVNQKPGLYSLVDCISLK